MLTRYAYYFAGRAGSATGGRVAFIDGYAGEGRYQDRSPGSPLLLASEATRAGVFGRQVKLAFVERDAGRREQLRQSLSEDGVEPDQLLGGSLENVIDELLERYVRHAVFLFVDPFGLAVSRSTLDSILSRRSPQQPIDVLFHFSLSTVARMGRAAVVEGPTSLSNAAQLDSAFGSVDWRKDFKKATAQSLPTEAALTVARRFGASVRASSGVPSTAVPVRQRPGQLPKYLLILFCADRRAHWDFADQASSAYVDWLYECDLEDYRANVRYHEQQGLHQLFPSPEPDRGNIDQKLQREAVEYLVPSLREMIYERGAVRLVDVVEGLYGDMLGRARATHVRYALKRLHEAGDVDDDGRGDFWNRILRWSSGS